MVVNAVKMLTIMLAENTMQAEMLIVRCEVTDTGIHPPLPDTLTAISTTTDNGIYIRKAIVNTILTLNGPAVKC